MADSESTLDDKSAENVRLKALVAQLEDRLDYLSEDQSVGEAIKRSASEVVELQELQRSIMANMSDVVLVATESGKLTYVSPNVHLIFGHSAEDALRNGRINFLFPNPIVDADIIAARGEVANVECTILDSIGRDRNLLVTIRQVQVAEGSLLYTVRDITERRRLESELELHKLSVDRKVQEQTEELRKSREMYRRLVEGLEEEYFFYEANSEGILSYVSPSIYNVLGYAPDEVIGHNWREFCDPDHPTYTSVEKREKLRFSGLATPAEEIVSIHKSGERRSLHIRDFPVMDSSGKVILNEGIARDMTALRRAEESHRESQAILEQRVEERTAELTEMYERLRESESRYRSVVEDSPDFIVRCTENGVRTFVNDAYCQYLGLSREEIIGTSFLPSVYEEDRDVLVKKLATVSIDNPVAADEHRYVLPDGRIVWQRWSNHALFDSNGVLQEFQSVGCDVTERRVAESRGRERPLPKLRWQCSRIESAKSCG